MWPSKPEVLISPSPTVWQMSLQTCFRPRPARRNWPRVIATMTDHQKLQHGRFARQSCNFWQSVVVAIIWLIFCRARYHRKSGIWRWNLNAICQSTGDVIILVCGPYRYFPLSVAVVFTCQQYSTPVHGLIPQICRWNFNCTFHSLRDISISGFGSRFRLFLTIGIV